MTLTDKQKILAGRVTAWSVGGLVSLLAVVAWGNHLHWRLGSLNPYLIFPLFGLLAFSLMWSNYVASVLRQQLKLDKTVLRRYFDTTGWAVLVLICLHPGLLIYQLFRDGAGLPPSSYEHYVAPGLAWVTLLGSASLLVFLAYELHRVYGKKSWWKYMQVSTDVAMLAIVYHSLRLGHNLISGWFHIVWWFYAVSLVGLLAYIYKKKYFSKEQ